MQRKKLRPRWAPWEFERREPREHDVVIDIKYCGICHSDIHQARDEWSENQQAAIFPMSRDMSEVRSRFAIDTASLQ